MPIFSARSCNGYTIHRSSARTRAFDIWMPDSGVRGTCLAPRGLDHQMKEVLMIRVLAVVVAVLLSVSLGVTGTVAQMKTDPAQPKMEQKSDKMGQKVEGTIKSVRGNMVTLEDGTQLSIPSSVKVAKDQLKPGAQITAEYEERAGQKVATVVQIKG